MRLSYIQLKMKIYQIFLIDSCQLNYKMALTGQEAYELLMMTPFAWRASEQVKENLQQAEVKEYTADF